jgi:hypothetical protein
MRITLIFYLVRILGKNDKKIVELNSHLYVPKSEYKDDALFELANTYVADDKNTQQ